MLAVASCAVPTLADTPSLPEHGPGLVGGAITLNDASFTTEIAFHSGTTASTAFCCVTLFDTGSSQTFVHQGVLEQMLSAGAATINCKQDSSPCSWEGFGKSVPLRTSTSVALSVQLFRVGQPTSSLAVWACVVPPSVMQYEVFVGRDSWMRFSTRSYRSFPPRPPDQRVFGKLALSHRAPTGADELQLLAVNLVRSNGYQLLQATISSKCWHSWTFFLPKNFSPLQGDRLFSSSARPTLSPVTF